MPDDMHRDLAEFSDVVWKNLPGLRSLSDVYDIYVRHGQAPPEPDWRKTQEQLRRFLAFMHEATPAIGDGGAPGVLDSRIQIAFGMALARQEVHTAFPETGEILSAIFDANEAYRANELAGAFFHSVRKRTFEQEKSQPANCRLYVALDPDDYAASSQVVFELLASLLGSGDRQFEGFVSFKIMGPFTEGRRDNVVAYFSTAEARKAVTGRVRKAARKAKFAGPLPFCIERQAEGIGWADEPPGRTSFGIYLATAIWEAAKDFRDTVHAEMPKPQRDELARSYRAAIAHQLRKDRIDARSPWSRVGRAEPKARARGRRRPPATGVSTRAATRAVLGARTGLEGRSERREREQHQEGPRE